MSTDQDSRKRKKMCRSLFSYLGKNPGTWWLSSNRLKEAADVLKDTCWSKERKHKDLKTATANFRIGPVYMLLMGMAIEAALKAIMVSQNSKLIEEQRITKDFNFTTHKLKDLWSQTGLSKIKCRQNDSLLDRLENFLVTFGRYPVSTTKHNMDTMIGSSFHEEPDFAEVTRLWVFLEKHLKKTSPELFEEENSKKDNNKS